MCVRLIVLHRLHSVAIFVISSFKSVYFLGLSIIIIIIIINIIIIIAAAAAAATAAAAVVRCCCC